MSPAQPHFRRLLRIFPWEILLPHTPSGDNFPCPVDPWVLLCEAAALASVWRRGIIEPGSSPYPDDFLSNHLNLAPGLFCEVIRKVRARLKNPPFTAEQYLAVLTQHGLVATASDLAQFSSLI